MLLNLKWICEKVFLKSLILMSQKKCHKKHFLTEKFYVTLCQTTHPTPIHLQRVTYLLNCPYNKPKKNKVIFLKLYCNTELTSINLLIKTKIHFFHQEIDWKTSIRNWSSEGADQDIPGVNSINILCTNFLYERRFGSFF